MKKLNSLPQGYYFIFVATGFTSSPEYTWTHRRTLEPLVVLNNSLGFVQRTGDKKSSRRFLVMKLASLILEDKGERSMEKEITA